MKLVRVYNYEKFNIPFDHRLRLYEIKECKDIHGIVLLKEFMSTQTVSFRFFNPLEERKLNILFEKIIALAKSLKSKSIIYYTLKPDAFGGFLLEKGGHPIKRREMFLDLKKYTPLTLPIPLNIKFGPFLITPLKEHIDLCFDAIPEYDREVFSTFSPEELFEFYTLLYVGGEGVFLPEYSINIYYNEKLAGFIMINVFLKTKITISDIVIFSPYQGRGLGKILLNESIRRMQQNREKNLFLSVTYKNKKAYNMYVKFGFEFLKDYLVYTYFLI